jgi:U6 snRNA-associated Sm-like protein LSm5
MKSDREFTGKLLGFDDFVSQYLFFFDQGHGGPHIHLLIQIWFSKTSQNSSFRDRGMCLRTYINPSETTPQGKKKTQLAQTLLNGNNICMASHFTFALGVADFRPIQLIPGSVGPDEEG